MNRRRWISLLSLLLALAGCAPAALTPDGRPNGIAPTALTGQPHGAAPTGTAAPSAADPGASRTGDPTWSPTWSPAPTANGQPHGAAPTGTAAPSAADPGASRTGDPTWSPTWSPAPTGTAAPPPALSPTPTLTPLDAAARERIFDETWNLVRQNYVYEDFHGLDWEATRRELLPRATAAATSEAFYAVMYELIDRLNDQHSGFESPQDVAAASAEYDGELRYGGIGARIRAVEGGGLVTWIVPGGPADLAGVQPRELVVAVNGVPFAAANGSDQSCPSCVVRGPPGTTVRLTLQAGTTTRDVTLVRALLSNSDFDKIEGRILAGTRVALVRIPTFYRDGVAEQTAQQITDLTGDGRLDGLILDVRDNSGGSVGQLLDTLALFLDGGDVGSARGRAGGGELNVPRGALLPNLIGVPLVVLVNEETASAAEIFAAGLRARGRARVAGARSSGNTENLIAHDLSDGSRLWLAERYYRLPDGSDIEGRGVTLDAEVNAEYWRYAAEDDPQVQAALRLLK